MIKPLPPGFHYVGAGVYVGPPDNTLFLRVGDTYTVTNYDHHSKETTVTHYRVEEPRKDA